MRKNVLYMIAVLLIIFWAIGLFIYTISAIIHVLLIIAIVSILIGIAQRRNRKAK